MLIACIALALDASDAESAFGRSLSPLARRRRPRIAACGPPSLAAATGSEIANTFGNLHAVHYCTITSHIRQQFRHESHRSSPSARRPLVDKRNSAVQWEAEKKTAALGGGRSSMWWRWRESNLHHQHRGTSAPSLAPLALTTRFAVAERKQFEAGHGPDSKPISRKRAMTFAAAKGRVLRSYRLSRPTCRASLDDDSALAHSPRAPYNGADGLH